MYFFIIWKLFRSQLIVHLTVVGQKILKNPGQKNSWTQINQFHFLQFQKWPKINFWTGKKFKTAKNAISHKKNFFYLFDFTRFFSCTCLNFLTRCSCESLSFWIRIRFFSWNYLYTSMRSWWTDSTTSSTMMISSRRISGMNRDFRYQIFIEQSFSFLGHGNSEILFVV